MARIVFGRDGYERGTIRAIAVEAEANPALVIRYYKDRECLFGAVATLEFDAARFARAFAFALGGDGPRRHGPMGAP